MESGIKLLLLTAGKSQLPCLMHRQLTLFFTDFNESSGEEEEPRVTQLSVNYTANANDCAMIVLSLAVCQN